MDEPSPAPAPVSPPSPEAELEAGSEPWRAPAPPPPDPARVVWAPLHGLVYGVGLFLVGFVVGFWALQQAPVLGLAILVGSALGLAILPGMTVTGGCPICGARVVRPWNRRCPSCRRALAVEDGRLVDRGPR
jgi:hypothetical protein